MKFKTNENGNALLLALGVIVLFAVLGVSLMTITTAGMKKNEIRQNTVLATDLSQKGIDYAITDIQTQLETAVKNGNGGKGLTKTEFTNLLKATIENNSIKCPNTINIGTNSDTKVCVESIKLVSNEEYKRIITLKSVGKANNKEFTTRTDYIIGTEAVPDQLRYAVSSNQGGDIYFRGGMEVYGDVKSSGNIYLNDYAFHKREYISDAWTKSTFLKLIPHEKSVSSKIILTNPEAKIFQHSKKSDIYSSTDVITDPSTELANKLYDTKNISIVNKTVVEDKFTITNKVSDIFNNRDTNNNLKHYDNNVYLGTLSSIFLNLFKSNRENTFLIADDPCISGLFCSDSNKKIGKADLTVFGINVELKGTYYVNGDVKITNANLNGDAIIYATGKVIIENSRLNGINPNNTIFIFAEKEIEFHDISEFESTPSNIKGFFYSNSEIIFDRVASNMVITGGISAKNVKISAVRGNTPYLDTWLGLEPGKKAEPTRLKIVYDDNLIKNYTSFKRDDADEYIKSIDAPILLEKK